MNLLEMYQIGWFSLLMVLITGYALLDGFDLGVGMLHLFSKKDEERRLMLNSIGPVWDGNEVWLVVAGGALFAGFPIAYAAITSGFYNFVMLFLSGIIFRAVAIEFRSKRPYPFWRWMWDVLFSVASLVISFGLGLVLGNLVRGVPLNEAQDMVVDSSLFFLNPYSILMGITTVACFSMHGAIYLLMKTEGELHDKVRTWINPAIISFIISYATVTMATLIYQPHMVEVVKNHPEFFLLALLTMLSIANIPREVNNRLDGRAFASSCFAIASLVALYALGTYPNLVRASNAPLDLSLTIHNSSSSLETLQILFIISGIGIPLVLAYTVAVYIIFHGKVKLDASSY